MKREILKIENAHHGKLLKRFHLQVSEGEIVNLVFDNIHEKLFLIEVLRGYKKFDFSWLYIDDKIVPERAQTEALTANVKVITNKDCLLDTLSIGENIFLARTNAEAIWIEQRRLRADAEALAGKFGINLDAEKPVRSLSVLEKIQIEMLKAYACGQRIIFMTSMSTFLWEHDLALLWQLIRSLQKEGISFVIMGPYEDMIPEYIDTVAIVKKGRMSMIRDISACNSDTVYKILYGEGRDEGIGYTSGGSDVRAGQVVLAGIQTTSLKDVTVEIPQGQIVRLFCLDEPDCDELIDVLNNRRDIIKGGIIRDGEEHIMKKRFETLAYGIGIVDENPTERCLFQDLSAMDNLCMMLSKKMNGIWSTGRYRRSVKQTLQDVFTPDIFTKPVKTLDVIEQQKIVYCRWLLYAPDLVICIRPFAEPDLRFREIVRDMIYMLAARGIGVLIITSNLLEFQFCRGEERYMKYGRMIEQDKALELLYK